MFDVMIVGGGAAGFYAAIHIGELCPEASIAIFEKGKSVLSKVKVSGGGRCNVTHAEFDPMELSKNYPRGEKELIGPFHRHAPGDIFQFFEERNISLKIEEDGRVFPTTDSSQTIIDCFQNAVDERGIKLLKNSGIKSFEYKEEKRQWQLTTKNKHYYGTYLVMATGSNTKIWQQLAQKGHAIIDAVPSLFTFNIDDERLKGIQGLSTPGTIEILPKKALTNSIKAFLKRERINQNMFSEGPILITHWGLSGPAVLGLSAWGARLLNAYNYIFQIKVNWAPDYTTESLTGYLMLVKENEPKKTIYRTKALQLPNRLWQSLVKASKIDTSLKWADIGKTQIQELAQQLTAGIFSVSGKSTFKEEFVTAGGVDLKEVDFKTYKSKKLPNLYFAGEILNIDGITGGFNFQNAWTGAYTVATALAEQLSQSEH